MLIELKLAKKEKKEEKKKEKLNTMIELYEKIFVKAQFTRICSQTQLVFTSLTCNTKKVVFSVSCFSSRVFKIHMKPASFFCQAMNLVQSEPKLTIQISKASFVVIPAAVEIN